MENKSSMWVLKRRPDGTIIKKKACYCVRGDIQELDAGETVYAPVVDWATVRIILIIAVALGLYTRQVDLRNVFVQSFLPKPIYIEMPQGFEQAGKVLKVKKSLYGDKRVPKLWFQHLRVALLRIGFTQSLHDPCLFFKQGIVFIVYVDDGIFVAIDIALIDQAISELHAEQFDLEEEDDYAGYLGISLH
jgi:Reverse transcriptase (RNA-dependent DNA polymerase)